MTTTCTMILGDCLEVMPTLPKASVQMCFADLPYGITSCEWDIRLDPREFMTNMTRVCVKNAVLAMTASQLLAASFISVNPQLFRHDLVWARRMPKGFLNAHRSPLRKHELILIFGKSPITYNPIIGARDGLKPVGHASCNKSSNYQPSVYGEYSKPKKRILNKIYPTSIIEVNESDLRHDV